MNAQQEKERVREELVALTKELTTRNVTSKDVARFNRFETLEVLQQARGRKLTEAESLALSQLLQQPSLVQSVHNPAIPKNYCNCTQRHCVECSAKQFVDTAFSDSRKMSFPPSASERTGIINNPPFPIFRID
uniref:Uncharacterized protein n=1 Tax=viral metagenome TaxID=1070528 RepID=A0A6C0IXA3_9ZZZZ